ncbi:hypothetical protein JI664_12615 [Rhodobacter sp. NTK016B]|uniref:hypothetical protein n=1 Tax=Rhodobacter sp. NTK016B TaxID=2759676 RepID=UPI001A8D2137|nr:hypothetical protein [Rhodobacter sp. NTK016B]MBN8292809.1 hypothetical protein [Rhodobacter sp. NTK016B]
MLKVLSAAVIAASGLGGCQFTQTVEEQALIACESVFSERLRSPSSYRRISATTVREAPFTFEWWDEYMRNRGGPDFSRGTAEERDLHARGVEIARHQEASGSFRVLSSVVRYEASNALGVSLAGQFFCEAVHRSGDENDEFDTVLVDGLSAFDYTLRQIRGG